MGSSLEERAKVEVGEQVEVEGNNRRPKAENLEGRGMPTLRILNW